MSSDSKIFEFAVHTLSDSLRIYFFHSGEQIQKYPDSLPNSPDTWGRKPYPERKSCGFKNIRRIRVNGAENYETFSSKAKLPETFNYLEMYGIGRFLNCKPLLTLRLNAPSGLLCGKTSRKGRL